MLLMAINQRNLKPLSNVAQRSLTSLFKLILVCAVVCLPVSGCWHMWDELQFMWPASIYLVMSSVTFLFYWSDKRRAQTERRRISENSLHLMGLIGGWPGGLLAQQLFRHKTRKWRFQLIFWSMILIHDAFWIDWFNSGGQHASVVLHFLMGR